MTKWANATKSDGHSTSTNAVEAARLFTLSYYIRMQVFFEMMNLLECLD